MAEKKASVVKVSKELLDMLNQAIAREIQVAIQYMWQHVQWGGVKGFAVHNELKSIAVAGDEACRVHRRKVVLPGRYSYHQTRPHLCRDYAQGND